MAILQPPVKLEATDGYGGDVAKELCVLRGEFMRATLRVGNFLEIQKV